MEASFLAFKRPSGEGQAKGFFTNHYKKNSFLDANQAVPDEA